MTLKCPCDPDLRYSSTISQREANEAPIENVQFPNIMLCTDSIHSKYKLRKMYPQVNDTLIQQFYGLDVDPTAMVSVKWVLVTPSSHQLLVANNFVKEF